MARDPFDISQYKLSFLSNDSYQPNAFSFADFENSFQTISNQIKLRQHAVSTGYGVPFSLFSNVQAYETTTPAALSDGIELFQNAILELVTGSIVDDYGKISGCDVYIGFFTFRSNGLPVLGEGTITPSGSFTEAPDPAIILDVIEFAKSIGESLNEFVFALNRLRWIHAKMVNNYEFDDSCGDVVPDGTSVPVVDISVSTPAAFVSEIVTSDEVIPPESSIFTPESSIFTPESSTSPGDPGGIISSRFINTGPF